MGLFNYFKDKFSDEPPKKEYPLGARLGASVNLDQSAFILGADKLSFDNVESDFNVVAIGEYKIQDLNVTNIYLLSKSNNQEIMLKVFGDNDIQLYQQIDKIELSDFATRKQWLDPDIGFLTQGTINLEHDFEKDWDDQSYTVATIVYDQIDADQIDSFNVSHATMFSRQIGDVHGVETEYLFITLEDDSSINLYIGIDFNAKSISVI